MELQQNFCLKKYNTFGIAVKAKFFTEVHTVTALKEALQHKAYSRKFILGGGSNLLLTQDLDALVIHIALKGITIQQENETTITIKVMGGENWHELVLYTLKNNYGGLENLSLIPGNTGTAPVQNIGAYGVELKDSFVSCDAVHRERLETTIFSKEACAFGYRDSIFKNEAKDTYVITAVTFKLTKVNHKTNTGYKVLQEALNNDKISQPTIQDISKAVIAIRNSKLPNPAIIGNSGSFFKNPTVSKSIFEKFTHDYPKAPFYKLSETAYKIPAGWLIEQCGYKGKRFGDAGVHEKQALVLVNYGDATGKEIVLLANKIISSVKDKFNITITPEVNLIT